MSGTALDVGHLLGMHVTQAWLEQLRDAIDNASDQDRVTWLTDHGRRVAAIVPADVAEHLEVTGG